MKSIVYIAINRENGHRYIGVTVRGLVKRRWEHINAASKGINGTYFIKALRRYGAEMFEWTILAEFDEPLDAYECEKAMIEALAPEYNISSGGRYGVLGLLRTEEWKRNISKAHTGRKNPGFGKKMWAKRIENGTDLTTPVTCLEDGQEFRGVTEAGVFYGMRSSRISSAADGNENITARGLHFARGINLTESERLERLAAIKDRLLHAHDRGNGLQRSVVCLDTGKCYRSAIEAAKDVGLNDKAIYQLCRTRPGSASYKNGMRFAFADTSLDEIRSHRRKKLTKEDVAKIKARIIAGDQLKNIAQDYKVSAPTIGAIKFGKTWRFG